MDHTHYLPLKSHYLNNDVGIGIMGVPLLPINVLIMHRFTTIPNFKDNKIIKNGEP